MFRVPWAERHVPCYLLGYYRQFSFPIPLSGWRVGLTEHLGSSDRWISWSGLGGLLIWKVLDARYLTRTTIKDALGNILDSSSLRIIEAIRFPLWE